MRCTMKLLCLIAAVMLRPLPPLMAGDVVLVENGQPKAEIVIAETPERMVRLAAHELQTYVEKISGAHLPIVTRPTAGATQLFVGRSAHTDKLGVTAEGLKFGAYRIVSGDNWLVLIGDDTDFTPVEPWARNNGDIASGKLQAAWNAITGDKSGVPNAGMYKHRFRLPGDIGLPDAAARPEGKIAPLEIWGFDERGSYNAVCGLLKKLGVRWYLPGPLGEVVPTQKTISLPPIDETVTPDFEVRRFNVRFAIVTPETAMWAMRLGMRDPNGLHVAHGLTNMTGHDEIFAAHPEWFALYGGKRHYSSDSSKNQLCYSNEELFQATVRYARAQFDQYDYEGVSIMPPDGYTSICQCHHCAGKDQLERGSRGSLSNYVWDFVNRVAKEVGKTHPKKLIVCCAYGAYSEPPSNIDKLEPNVQVVIVGGRRPSGNQPEQQASIRRLREGWRDKTDRPYMVFENYPITDRGWYLPAFVPKAIGASVTETKGQSRGEDIWLSFGRTFDDKAVGFNHFQVYFTAAMYWGGRDQKVEKLLDEYVQLFYGPAAEEMLGFFNYCEDNWQGMEADKSKVDAALAQFAKAQAKVAPDSIHGQRVALIDDFLNELRKKSVLLAQKRGVVPTLRMVGDAKNIVIDGKLDDAYWEKCPTAATGRLRELQTGRSPIYGTQIKSGWASNSVYFAIRCDENPGEKLNITATKKEDAAIWYGDAVELLIETDSHSYYQIAVNPAGAMVDYDRGSDKSGWSRWESQAEVATHVADDHWTVEIRIPVTDDENDPLNQLVGRKPTQSLPWHINICRQRIREHGAEHSALSPTGTGGFHERMRFAHFYDGRSHQFAADPTVTNYLTADRAAGELVLQRKYPEALAAYTALAEGKITDVQKSAALKRAAFVACRMQDFNRADEITATIPIVAERKTAEMHNLLAQRKFADLLARFGDEDFSKWPFWALGEGYYARGKAYAATGDAAKAEADLRAALSLTTDKKARQDIEQALEKASAK